MTDHPIIFSAPMIRALLDGRKTMTRRLAWRWMDVNDNHTKLPSPWQRVKPGDRLWCRENWGCPEADRPGTPDGRKPKPGDRIVLQANPADAYQWQTGHPGCADFCWRPSIHMPRWASRLTLIVTATKIEPLLDISEADARAEGFAEGKLDDGFGPRDIGGGYTIESPGTLCSAAGMFQVTWTKLHPDWDGYSSPEVVALTFAVHKLNIDAMERAA